MDGATGLTAVNSEASPVAPQPRLVRAAHEFEAQMLKELMGPMTGSDSLTGEDDDSGSSGALGEFASEALGRALSERGGFGIASRIVHDLSHTGNQDGTTPVTGMVHNNTVIGSNE
jgi:Rod binding domain-containing protein